MSWGGFSVGVEPRRGGGGRYGHDGFRDIQQLSIKGEDLCVLWRDVRCTAKLLILLGLFGIGYPYQIRILIFRYSATILAS